MPVGRMRMHASWVRVQVDRVRVHVGRVRGNARRVRMHANRASASRVQVHVGRVRGNARRVRMHGSRASASWVRVRRVQVGVRVAPGLSDCPISRLGVGQRWPVLRISGPSTPHPHGTVHCGLRCHTSPLWHRKAQLRDLITPRFDCPPSRAVLVGGPLRRRPGTPRFGRHHAAPLDLTARLGGQPHSGPGTPRLRRKIHCGLDRRAAPRLSGHRARPPRRAAWIGSQVHIGRSRAVPRLGLTRAPYRGTGSRVGSRPRSGLPHRRAIGGLRGHPVGHACHRHRTSPPHEHPALASCEGGEPPWGRRRLEHQFD